MLFRGLTIDSRLNLLSMVSRSYLTRLVWSHGFVCTLPGTHTNNIVPVSSSIHGVFVCTPVPRQSYIYFYTEIGLYLLKNSCPEIESGGLRYLADYPTLDSCVQNAFYCIATPLKTFSSTISL